jgi:thiamine kinase-like enzyme
LDSAAERAAKLPIWRGRVEPQPVPGGLTNTNLVVEDGGRRYMVRIGGDIDVHCVSRANELAASRAAHLAGLAPEAVYAEPGVLVLAFIEGRTFTADDVKDRRNRHRIVALLHRCHRDIPKFLKGAGILFWPFHVIRQYGHVLRQAHASKQDDVPRLLAAADDLERGVGPIELVFGHNDLLAANIIDDGARLWLVDWEYAGFNSPLFDLGGLASNSGMPEPMREELLEHYYERPVTDELRRRFAAMTAVSLLRETLWSMASEVHSALEFDYRGYTAENLARFDAAYADFLNMERS